MEVRPLGGRAGGRGGLRKVCRSVSRRDGSLLKENFSLSDQLILFALGSFSGKLILLRGIYSLRNSILSLSNVVVKLHIFSQLNRMTGERKARDLLDAMNNIQRKTLYY